MATKMTKENICIRIPSEVEARMSHRLLVEAGEKIYSKKIASLKSDTRNGCYYVEFCPLTQMWAGSSNDKNKQVITIYQLRELLGLAPQMGRRPKYAEPTKCVSFRVPISKIEAIKALVREELSKVEIKKEETK